AEAMTQLSSTRLAEDQDADRACVVVHVDAAALAGEGSEGAAQLAGEHPIAIEGAQRLACDSRLEVVADGPDGVPAGVGRARRTIPAWLWRVLERRDGGRCRFPGCDHRRWLQGHHITWWSRDGRTDLDNLVMICSLCRPRHKLHYADLAFMPSWTVAGV